MGVVTDVGVLRWSRRAARVATAALLLAYIFVALWPFQWEPPYRVRNGAKRRNDGTLEFVAPGIIRALRVPDWLDAAARGPLFAVQLRVRSWSPHQGGPARIFTVSQDHHRRNVTIAQEGSHLVVRLRTRATNQDGVPSHTVPDVFALPQWREISLRVDQRTLTLTLDGRTMVRQRLPEKPLANWDRHYAVALGNEHTGERPWVGEIARASVTTAAGTTDYLRADVLEAPPHYWVGFDYRPLSSLLTLPFDRGLGLDVILNLICFVPLGFCVTVALNASAAILPGLIACSAASLAMETLQAAFAHRSTSAVDLCMNIVGAAGGACLAKWYARRVTRGRQSAWPS